MSWLKQIEDLKPGDACEFRYSAYPGWMPGIVERNGGSWYWEVRHAETGEVEKGIVIECVRCPGQAEAWPSWPAWP